MRTAIALAIAIVVVACGVDSNVSRVLGARCDVTADCDERCLAPSAEFPDGMCTVDCSEDADCPGNSHCIDREGGVCLFTCATDPDCGFLGPGWECKEDSLRANPSAKVNICRGD
jgi:hypothetical protein